MPLETTEIPSPLIPGNSFPRNPLSESQSSFKNGLRVTLILMHQRRGNDAEMLAAILFDPPPDASRK